MVNWIQPTLQHKLNFKFFELVGRRVSLDRDSVSLSNSTFVRREEENNCWFSSPVPIHKTRSTGISEIWTKIWRSHLSNGLYFYLTRNYPQRTKYSLHRLQSNMSESSLSITLYINVCVRLKSGPLASEMIMKWSALFEYFASWFSGNDATVRPSPVTKLVG